MVQRSRRGGFTLIEIMIAVAIIGTLAAIAIPGYTIFQARSRRSEAYMNTFAIIQTADSYYAEYQSYPASIAPMPGGIAAIVGIQKRPWDAASQLAYSALGWGPEGSVFYDYGITGTDVEACGTCAPGTCLTVAAYGDVDGDGKIATVLYTRGLPGAACPEILFGQLPALPNHYNTTATYTDLNIPGAPY